MKNEICFDCKKPLPVMPAGHTGGTGYATLPNGEKVCYPCADKRQVEDLKDRSKPFSAYVGKGIITSWTGGKLMTITRSKPAILTRRSHWHDSKSFRSIHAVDAHGGHWSGRGSEGVLITMRPVKG